MLNISLHAILTFVQISTCLNPTLVSALFPLQHELRISFSVLAQEFSTVVYTLPWTHGFCFQILSPRFGKQSLVFTWYGGTMMTLVALCVLLHECQVSTVLHLSGSPNSCYVVLLVLWLMYCWDHSGMVSPSRLSFHLSLELQDKAWNRKPSFEFTSTSKQSLAM